MYPVTEMLRAIGEEEEDRMEVRRRRLKREVKACSRERGRQARKDLRREGGWGRVTVTRQMRMAKESNGWGRWGEKSENRM